LAIHSARHMGEKAIWARSKLKWKAYRMLTVKGPYPGDCPPRPYYPWRGVILGLACKLHELHAKSRLLASCTRWCLKQAHAPQGCPSCPQGPAMPLGPQPALAPAPYYAPMPVVVSPSVPAEPGVRTVGHHELLSR
jgi:hypothetical protein